MTCPSETYSDAFLPRRSGNPNTRYRAIESKTWRWHFRGVVYIFRKHRLFAQVTDKPLFCEKHCLSAEAGLILLRSRRGWKCVRETFQASLRDALSVRLYPALKAPGYSQTPLRGANPGRLCHSAD